MPLLESEGGWLLLQWLWAALAAGFARATRTLAHPSSCSNDLNPPPLPPPSCSNKPDNFQLPPPELELPCFVDVWSALVRVWGGGNGGEGEGKGEDEGRGENEGEGVGVES